MKFQKYKMTPTPSDGYTLENEYIAGFNDGLTLADNDLLETSGIENLKRAERKAKAIVALILLGVSVFVAGLFALVAFGHVRSSLIILVSAYVVGFAFLIWEARQAPDLTCAGTVDGNCQRPPSKTGAGHSVSRHASLVEVYHDLDRLTEDFKANGWDTKGILAAKSDLAKRIFNHKPKE